MPRIGPIEMVALNLAMPRGDQALWDLIREADKVGPWAVRDIADQTELSRRRVSQLVEALRRGGFAAIVGTRPTVPGVPDANLFRLALRPIDVPRLRRDGAPLPEPATQTLWRLMRIKREFTAGDLHATATQADLPQMKLSRVRAYLSVLKGAGILAMVGAPGGNGRQAHYRLLRDLGPRAPKIVEARMAFDPNARAVVGTVEGREVKP